MSAAQKRRLFWLYVFIFQTTIEKLDKKNHIFD